MDKIEKTTIEEFETFQSNLNSVAVDFAKLSYNIRISIDSFL